MREVVVSSPTATTILRNEVLLSRGRTIEQIDKNARVWKSDKEWTSWQIASVTDYYDMATFLTQLGGPPNRLPSASPTERTS
jgi:hypothetical protein